MSIPFGFSLDGKAFGVDLLSPLPSGNLVVEISSRCNLRCTFCPKSEPGNAEISGRDMDMSPAIIDRTLAFIREQRIPHVSFIGIGEPTFHAAWREVFARFAAEPGLTLLLNTNLGLRYEKEDFDCLVRFASIVISVESADPLVQKELRRSVDLAVIAANIVSLRARARMLELPRPKLFVNCTVTQRNAFGLRDLAAWCVEVGVDQLNLSTLYETDSARKLGNRSIESLPADQLAAVQEELAHAQRIVAGTATRLSLQPRLQQVLAGAAETDWQQGATTRICLQPWGAFTVGADGQVFPCCAADRSLAHIHDPANEIINGEAIRALRRQLVEGALPQMCVKCSNAPLGAPDELSRAIALRAYTSGVATPLPIPEAEPSAVVNR
jgi:MoaA/NifB/PqqE/SkfB family radical SAM enzyme